MGSNMTDGTSQIVEFLHAVAGPDAGEGMVLAAAGSARLRRGLQSQKEVGDDAAAAPPAAVVPTHDDEIALVVVTEGRVGVTTVGPEMVVALATWSMSSLEYSGLILTQPLRLRMAGLYTLSCSFRIMPSSRRSIARFTASTTCD